MVLVEGHRLRQADGIAVCPLGAVHRVITDWDAPAAAIAILRAASIKAEVVALRYSGDLTPWLNEFPALPRLQATTALPAGDMLTAVNEHH